MINLLAFFLFSTLTSIEAGCDVSTNITFSLVNCTRSAQTQYVSQSDFLALQIGTRLEYVPVPRVQVKVARLKSQNRLIQTIKSKGNNAHDDQLCKGLMNQQLSIALLNSLLLRPTGLLARSLARSVG